MRVENGRSQPDVKIRNKRYTVFEQMVWKSYLTTGVLSNAGIFSHFRLSKQREHTEASFSWPNE